MDLELVVRGGALDGKVFPLTQGMTHTIGRMPQCEIQIEDEAVSRKHCALQTLNGEVLVTDLRSANGTFVNEARIEATRIMPGDQLRIGSTVLECRTGAARKTAPKACKSRMITWSSPSTRTNWWRASASSCGPAPRDDASEPHPFPCLANSIIARASSSASASKGK